MALKTLERMGCQKEEQSLVLLKVHVGMRSAALCQQLLLYRRFRGASAGA